ncbi:replication initiation protein [uncultured Prevotella sp.]|uniref:replication initiation protein n=1 Tax=uncultured Prevotella sp. TaxID=159272 RepID=UPI00206D7DF4|nr:replication initiation protein [uncultured Prevotella sp.]DAO57304.1 MAG TPA: DNA REPLICATION protein [Caudoviricetes sp.]
MEREKQLPQQYISTPFAYTKFSKNLSLLQQTVLTKVSEHLQGYVRHFFGSDLRKDRKVPRPLFSEAEKSNGMPEFVMSYAELGVDIANYNVARAAVQEVLNLTVDAPSEDSDGKASVKAFNIFSHANISFEGGTGVSFRLNPEVVDYVFDMSQGYVRHPADIARIGQIERMPMMYYYLHKKSEHWKHRVVRLTVLEIKTYLGMLGKITEGTDERSGRPRKGGKEKKEAYPKFSQFKKNVIETSINDINRLRKDGLLDVCVSYEPIYNGKRKVGNPAYIEFTIYDTIGQMQQAKQQRQQLDLFADVEELKPKPGEKEWQQLVAMLDGKTGVWLGSEMSDVLRKVNFEYYKNNTVLVIATQEQVAAIEDLLENDVLQSKLSQLLGHCFKGDKHKKVCLYYNKLNK